MVKVSELSKHGLMEMTRKRVCTLLTQKKNYIFPIFAGNWELLGILATGQKTETLCYFNRLTCQFIIPIMICQRYRQKWNSSFLYVILNHPWFYWLIIIYYMIEIQNVKCMCFFMYDKCFDAGSSKCYIYDQWAMHLLPWYRTCWGSRNIIF